MKKILIFMLTALVAGCSTIVDTPFPLNVNFENNSDYFLVEKPKFFIKDSHYNKSLSNYYIDNTRVSFQSTKKRRVYVEGQKPTIFEYLIFDERAFTSNLKMELDSFQEFSFDLKSQSGLVSQSRCEIHALSVSNADDDEHPTRYSSLIETRLHTYLKCKITQDSEKIKFSLLTTPSGETKLQFDGMAEPFYLESVAKDKFYIQRKGYIEQRDIPPWAREISGFNMYKNQQQLAAISLDEDAEYWLRHDMDENTYTLALTLCYSLTMLSWLDYDWNSQ